MLSVAKAAKLTGLSQSLLYAWCADGTLPHLRVGRKGKRGSIRIDPADLQAVLASLKVGGRKEPPPPPVIPLRPRHIRMKP